MVVNLMDDLQEVKEKPKKKKPSPLSMRTGDMLAQLEGASPIAQSSMLRGLGDVERQRGQNEQGLAMLHRQREMETVSQSDKLMSRDEWVQATHPELWAKRRGKVTRRENKLVEEGYATYLIFQKAKQQQTLNQARVGTERAQGLSYGRANRAKTIASYITQQLDAGLPIDPRAIELHNAGLTSQEGIAARKLASTEGMAQQALGADVRKSRAARGDLRTSKLLDREAAMERSISDRAGRMDIAKLKGSEEKQVVPAQRLVELGESASAIGKPMKTSDDVMITPSFEEWMAEYMLVARMTTPSDRATLKKALGRHLPSIDELEDMIVMPQGTQAQPAEMRSFLGVDRLRPDKAAIAAAPPTPENIEQSSSQLDMVIEALRLHGESAGKRELEKKIARLRGLIGGSGG